MTAILESSETMSKLKRSPTGSDQDDDKSPTMTQDEGPSPPTTAEPLILRTSTRTSDRLLRKKEEEERKESEIEESNENEKSNETTDSSQARTFLV